MSLKEKQIKAVRAALKYVKKEWKRGQKLHLWHTITCPLCKDFYNHNSISKCCKNCVYGEEMIGCATLYSKHYLKVEGGPWHTTAEDVAGLLKCTEIYLEENN